MHPVELGEFHQGGRAQIAFGQREQLAGLEGQVPAPVADPFGRRNLRLERRGGIEQPPEFLDLTRGPGPFDQQFAFCILGADRFEFVAPRVDQPQPVGLAQHRMRHPLDDIDLERIG